MIAALLWMACFGGGDDKETGTETGDTDTGELTCAERSVDTCLAGDCGHISGRALQDDGEGGLCVDFDVESEPYGCLDAEAGCGDAETLAASPDSPDQCIWFPNTCLPTGWVNCGDGWADECVD